MKRFIHSLILFIFFSLTLSNAQNTKQGIAILDLSERNNETNDARLFSVEHLVKVVGVPYVVTQDMAEAETYAMIFCTSKLIGNTFVNSEKATLTSYVENGGILLSPRVEDEALFSLFGVDGYESSTARYEMTWDNATAPNADVFRWINEQEELTVSLGRDTYDSIYKTLGYNTTTAESLAHFVDGSSAITTNIYGAGQAVTIGLSLKDVILRNQINRDYEAQRITSNGFEPTTDAFILFVRGLYMSNNPFAVWKHTSLGNSAATVMVTHDIDSQTGMDTLRSFVDYEQANNIEATYNVTVRYFDDDLMSPFYLNQQNTMSYIKEHGQAFGSHSVGHFFDFADEDVFPVGEPGLTQENYNPFNDGDITVGGTVYGECEISKNILEEDIDIDIRAFRAGHLAYPKYLVNVLDELGYEYNSTHSAADVLTNFPYQNKMGRSFSGAHSSVYEIPVTISDVFHANPISASNFLDKAETWLDVTLKNRANAAPTVLLIHPNRGYKLTGMAHYLENLPSDIHIEEMSRFGDYWKARENLNFDSHIYENEMTILISSMTNLEDNISFVVKDGQSLNNIVVKDEGNNNLNFSLDNWGNNDVIVYYSGLLNETSTVEKSMLKIEVYPNPAQIGLNIKFELDFPQMVQMDLFDGNGSKVMSILNEKMGKGVHQISKNIRKEKLSSGIYFLVGEIGKGRRFSEKVVFMGIKN